MAWQSGILFFTLDPSWEKKTGLRRVAPADLPDMVSPQKRCEPLARNGKKKKFEVKLPKRTSVSFVADEVGNGDCRLQRMTTEQQCCDSLAKDPKLRLLTKCVDLSERRRDGSQPKPKARHS